MPDIFRRTNKERQEAAGLEGPDSAASAATPTTGSQTKFAGIRVETEEDKKRKAKALEALLRSRGT